MKTQIISIGNSQGVRIPKALLEQSKLSGEVELELKDEGILIRAARKPREGWAEAFAAAGEDDSDVEFADWNAATLSSFDDEEW